MPETQTITALPAATSGRLGLLPGIVHGFYGRQGGVSEGIYASLNAGPGSDDDAAAVLENRRRIAAGMGVTPDRLISAHQIHSSLVETVSGPLKGERPKVDGLVSRCPNIAITILTADCTPVLFVDPTARVIGAAHAGWKGAIGGILEATVAAMVRLGASPARIVAAIGPCIAQDSYEVGPEFEQTFLEAAPDSARFFVPGDGDRRHFDLKAFCASRLRMAGVGVVDVLPDDTCADEARYFSNRRRNQRGEPDYGRNLSAIRLAG
jgi:polyphenol oxidase